MSLLKKRPIAILIMIAAILLGTLIGCWRSLTAEKQKVEDCFYSGSLGDGYSIQSDLEYINATAGNLKTVALRYLAADSPAITELNSARSALIEAETVKEKYIASISLYEAVTNLHGALDPGELDMNSTDERFRSSLYDDISSAMQRISHNEYNDAARAFNSALGGFPAALISGLIGLQPAQLFG